MTKEPQRAPSLTDDLLFEILRRVPYRSLCRFKCVSKSWFALCSAPDIRKRSTQGASGFFCYSSARDDDNRYGLRFLNISGKGHPLVDPSLPFLQELGYKWIMFRQCCNGLLAFFYVPPRSRLIMYPMLIMLRAIPQLRSGPCCRIQRSNAI